MTRPPEPAPSFTKFVLVVLGMGLVGAMGIPRRSEASDAARIAEARQALESFRDALESYRADHGTFPATPAALTGAPERYLAAAPRNPMNGRARVELLPAKAPFPERPNRRAGWTYRPSTGELRINVVRTLPGTSTRLYDL